MYYGVLGILLCWIHFTLLNCIDGVIQHGNLPIFVINTAGYTIPNPIGVSPETMSEMKEIDINATMTVYGFGDSTITDFYNISMSLHGQSTLSLYPKVPYGFHTLKGFAQIDDKDNVHILGLPKSARWVLKAPFFDRSLMRDVLAFNLSRTIGMYASRTRFVEIYIVEEGKDITPQYPFHYQGIYLLEEQIERDDDRVDVSKMKDYGHPEEGGGLILKADKLDENDKPIHLKRGLKIGWVYPRKSHVNSNVSEYVASFLNEFEDMLHNDTNYLHTHDYLSWIDTPSFVDYFLLSEIFVSSDGYRYSVYFYRNSCEKSSYCPIYMGPPWDYNLAFGLSGMEVDPGGQAADYKSGWRYDYEWHKYRPDVAQWYARLLSDPLFANTVRYRWKELRGPDGLLQDQYIRDIVDEWTSFLSKGAQQRNFAKWTQINTDYGGIWPRAKWPWPLTFEDATLALQEWAINRMQWMDANIDLIFPHSYTADKTTCNLDNTCTLGDDLSCLPPFPGYSDCESRMRWVIGKCKDPSWSDFGTIDCTACSIQQFLHEENEGFCPSVGSNQPTMDLKCMDGECSQSKVCPGDLKKCPDGSFVDRDLQKNCEFRDCPSVAPTTAPTTAPIAAPSASPIAAPIATPTSTSIPSIPSASMSTGSNSYISSFDGKHQPKKRASYWVTSIVIASILSVAVVMVIACRCRKKKQTTAMLERGLLVDERRHSIQ